MSENVSKTDAPQRLTTKHQNTFHDILCLNGYPENSNQYLTIFPGAQMGSESIAHEAEGRMGAIDSEAMRNNCFSKIQLVGQKKYQD